MNVSAPAAVVVVTPAPSVPMKTCAFGTHPTDAVVARIPTVRLVRATGRPVCRLTESLRRVSRTLAVSPGSATPSGTASHTPLPGWPEVSQ